MNILFRTPLGEALIACDVAAAPKTLAALRQALPLRAPLHTPKIAGNHLYWHAPFVCDPEAGRDVLDLPAGSFAFWPERQFLELIFAPLQAETATITPLGRLLGDLTLLRALGQEVREGAGVVWAELRIEGETPPEPGPAASPLEAARREVWRACPEEVLALAASRGILHPLGPLLFAESEARTLHELLWRLRLAHAQGQAQGQAHAARFAAALGCDKAQARLGGFCHLHAAAGVLSEAAAAFADPAAPGPLVFEEAILYVGKLASWLDLLAPWNALNETLRAHPRTNLHGDR